MSDQKSFLEFEYALVPGSRKGAAKAAGATSRDLWQIPRDKIRIIPNFNPRITTTKSYKSKLREIAESMKQNGFYQSEPIEVYVAKEDGVDVYLLTDGHRRLGGYDLAVAGGAELGGLIPAVPCAEGTSLEDLTVGFVRHNNTRQELSPYELGVVCKRLVTYNWEFERIAEYLSVTQAYVESLLLLIGSDRRVRELVINEEINAGVAIEMLRKHGAKAYEVLASSLAKAKADGKKLTRSALPHVAFKKSVAKAAPTMFVTLRDVRNDPGYQSIAPDLRERLEALVIELDKLEADANANKPAKESQQEQQKLVA